MKTKAIKQVVTYNGESAPLNKCKKIKGLYYEKDKSCFEINGKWYSINSNLIFLDSYENKYKIKGNLNIKKGVVSIDPFTIGYYEFNSFYNCFVYIQGQRYECANYQILKEAGFVENINEGTWYDSVNEVKLPKTTLPDYVIQNVKNTFEIVNPNEKKQFQFKDNAYNIEDSREYESIKKAYENFNTPLTKDVKKAAKLIGNVSFGCELEVTKGMLPSYYLNQLGIYICKDGSINYTPEFVTVPYKGAKGLQSLKNLFIETNKRCETDYRCSLHYHIGNIRTDREFLVAFYKLMVDTQKDLLKMLPFYKTDPNGVKDKNYCKTLSSKVLRTDCITHKDKVNDMYNNLQTFILDSVKPNDKYNRKTKIHPNGKNKWNYPRYTIVNFVNMFINNRLTLEFRPHHAVLDPVRSINWLFICIAFIKFAENNSSKILYNTYTIRDVLNYYKNTFKTTYANNVSDYLIAYYEERVSYFRVNQNDIFAEKDYTNYDYSFKHGNLDSIF